MNRKTTRTGLTASAVSKRQEGTGTFSVSPVLIQIVGLCAAVLMTWLMLSSTLGERYGISIGLFFLFTILLLRSPDISVVMMLIYLALSGGMRRWLIPVLDYVSNDPLLLVVPLALTAYLSVLYVNRYIVLDSRLSKRIRWLLVLMVLQIFNPLQGGWLVGVAGAIFYIIPIFWYFLGRQVGTPLLLSRLFSVTVLIAIAAAVYGLKQTWFGFADSELEWLRLTKFTQILAVGSARPFSFFTQGGEYTIFVGVAIAFLWGSFLRGRREALLPIPFLLAALILGTFRSSVVATLLACTVIWAVQGHTLRSWLPRGVLALVIGVVGLTWSLQEASQVSLSGEAKRAMTHQVNGLLDAGNSTASGHASQFTQGILSSFLSPAGRGLGVTTLAADKYGNGTGASSEFDISDMFLSLGPLGGVMYIAIMLDVFGHAFRYWQRVRTVTAICIIGALFLFVGHWLQAGYAGSIVVWFSIGVLDREEQAYAIQKQKESAV